MKAHTPTLVVVLCMHRSGSSYTAHALQELGMSLGPFPLLGAERGNEHGHFESLPFLELGRKVQHRALGYENDSPETPQNLAEFLGNQGAWRDDAEISDSLLAEGRRLVAALIESGPISGFKDPRTALLWPFWSRVFESFQNIRLVAMPLLRSPHEIAMSLCARVDGRYGYWSALEVVAVHFTRIKAILETGIEHSPPVRFGASTYLADLESAARFCGLEWNPQAALAIFKPTSVHYAPAAVCHHAQTLYEALGGQPPAEGYSEANARRIARDSRQCEEMAYRMLGQSNELVLQQQAQLNHERQRALQLQREIDLLLDLLDEKRRQLALAQDDATRAHDAWDELASECQLLRAHRDRIETHPVLGRMLRARRHLKALLPKSFAHHSGAA